MLQIAHQAVDSKSFHNVDYRCLGLAISLNAASLSGREASPVAAQAIIDSAKVASTVLAFAGAALQTYP